MTTPAKIEPPRPSAVDVLHTALRAALGSVPVVGAAAVELFALVVATPLEKRRHRWMEEVATRLVELGQKGCLRCKRTPDRMTHFSIASCRLPRRQLLHQPGENSERCGMLSCTPPWVQDQTRFTSRYSSISWTVSQRLTFACFVSWAISYLALPISAAQPRPHLVLDRALAQPSWHRQTRSSTFCGRSVRIWQAHGHSATLSTRTFRIGDWSTTAPSTGRLARSR